MNGSPETEAERLARIRRNLARFKEQGYSREEVAAYLKSEQVSPETSRGTPWLETALQGIPFANRAVAAGRAIGSPTTMGEELTNIRGNINRNREEHPVAAFLAELGGGLAVPGFGALKTAATAGKLKRFGAAVAPLAGQGAAAGLSEADLQDTDLTTGAGFGGAAALALGGALKGAARLPRAVRSGSTFVRSFVSDEAAKQRAVDQLREIATAQGEPSVRGRVATIRAEGGNPLGFEAFGPEGRETLEASLRQKGVTGAQRLAETLEQRSDELPGRLRTAVRTELDVPAEAVGTRQRRFKEQASAASGPLYDEAVEQAKAFDAGHPAPKQPRAKRPAEQDAPVRIGLAGEASEARKFASQTDEALIRRARELSGRSEKLDATIQEGITTGRGSLPDAEARVEAAEDALQALKRQGVTGKRLEKAKQALLAAEEDADSIRTSGHLEEGEPVDPRQRTRFQDTQSELDAITDEANRRGITDQRLWMDELPKKAPLDPVQDALVKAAKLPFVRQEIRRLKRLPRSKWVKSQPTDHEMLAQIYKNIGSRIRRLERTDASRGLGAEDMDLLDNLKAQRPILAEAIEGRAEAHGLARAAHAEVIGQRESLLLGRRVAKMDPDDVSEIIRTGTMREGNRSVDRAEFVRGVGYWIDDLIGRKAGAASLASVTDAPNAAEVFDSQAVEDRLRAALGDKYDRLLPIIRRAFVESRTGTEVRNLARPSALREAAAEGALRAGGSGLGFGMQAATRRSLFGAGKALVAKSRARTATEKTRMLSAGGPELDKTLDEIFKMVAAAKAQPQNPSKLRDLMEYLRASGLASGVRQVSAFPAR